MTDELDVVRPPVRVGDPGPEPAGHPAIEARSIITLPVPRPPARPAPLPPPALRPPDPLGVLGGHDPHDPVRTAAEPTGQRSRWLVGAVAAVVALIAVAAGAAVLTGTGDDSSERAIGAGTVPTAPLDRPATTVPTTVAATPTVTVAAGRSAVGEPSCNAAACRFLDATLAGFDPGTVVTVTCNGASAGAFATHPVAIGPDGTATDSSCYFGYAGEEVWVEADGVRSATIVWPA